MDLEVFHLHKPLQPCFPSIFLLGVQYTVDLGMLRLSHGINYLTSLRKCINIIILNSYPMYGFGNINICKLNYQQRKD